MKRVVREPRSDFSGGVNAAAARDDLNANELARCENARVDPFGGVVRRIGARKLHTAALNGPVIALKLCQNLGTTGSSQLIAITSVASAETGYLWYSNPPHGSWTNVGPIDFAIAIPDLVTFRDTSPGAPLLLFLAGGAAGVRTFDGVTLSASLSGVNGVPLATRMRAFGTRLMMNDYTSPKTIFWSKIGNGADFRTGGISDGGSALVDVLTGDSIVALEILGSSVLIADSHSIARFTGTSDDIRIHQDTQGISSTVGPSGDNYGSVAFLRTDQFVTLHSERGIYIATEAGVVSIGDKIQALDQQALQMTTTAQSIDPTYTLTPIIGHNRQRNEAWVAYVPSGGTRRTNVMVYNYRRQCWYGPFFYKFGITCFGTFLNANSVESIIAGCDDGFVRALDDLNAGTLDDGTEDFDAVVEFPYFGLGIGPHQVKVADRVYLQTLGTLPFSVVTANEFGVTDVATLVS